MEVNKTNKYLSNFYNLKTSLVLVRAALDHHLKVTASTKKIHLRQPCTWLVKSPFNNRRCHQQVFAIADTCDPRVLHQAA